jgi:hypothetical protein
VVVQRPPFTTTRPEEERALDKGRVFTVRLPEDDDAALRELKSLWNEDTDNAAVRAAILFSLNVTRAQFAGGLAARLFKKKRRG